jgi:lipopolysaccharide/colanic/teichoic acid biosynthesis glycosyltransferase
MASGRPVITTDMPGCRDAVTHEWSGFIVPPRDASALAAAMTRFLHEPDLIGRMGARARRIAEERFDVAKVNAQLLAEMGLDTGAHRPERNRARQALGDRSGLQLPIAALAALVLLPIMAIVASSVILSLGRPIFFKQRRAGANGENFDLVKFRTMRDLRDSGGRLLADSARLTLTGRVLRRARLDELPELWNVLRREMNLVGPRPLLPETVAAMGEGGIVRGAVRPGLTGWAQVNGNALLRDVDKLTLDLWYVRNRSLRLDLAIILKTLVVIFRGERINHVNIERGYACTIDRSR